MLLQRKHYRDPNGLKSPVVSGIKLKRLSADGKQKITPKMVEIGQSERWLSHVGSKIVIHSEGGNVVFNIVQEPGRYCCHCGEKLPDDQTGEAARAHVTAKHAGKKSPDEQNPSGYAMQNYYDCELEVSRG